LPDRPPLPGAIGASHLQVYDSQAPDGLRGGTPHLHTACSEAYAVVAGSGAVQTLSPAGFVEVPLSRGAFVWFTPGTVHRLVNLDGQLEIFVIMQNSGLPEAGDLVCTFPDEILADPAEYRALADLPSGDVGEGAVDVAARRRRDLAVTGFVELRRAVETSGSEGLAVLYERAAALVRERVPCFRAEWQLGPACVAAATAAQLDALERGDYSHLECAGVYAFESPPEPRRPGCCGTLGRFVP
jgi:mannose-6-phosphate isomerase-like protein (cupin superfamily)